MLAWLVSDAFSVGLQMATFLRVFIWPFLSLCSPEEERVGGRQGGREGRREREGRKGRAEGGKKKGRKEGR